MVDSVSTVLTLGQGELCWPPWLTLYRLIPDLKPRPFTRRKKGLPWALEDKNSRDRSLSANLRIPSNNPTAARVPPLASSLVHGFWEGCLRTPLQGWL